MSQLPRWTAFGRASEEPYRRRSSDAVRLAAAVAVLAALAARAPKPIGVTQLEIFQLFGSLPANLVPQFRDLERLGTLWAVGLVVAAAVVGRRWRLARDLSLSGALAWSISRVLGTDVVGHAGLRSSLRTLTHLGITPNFPPVRIAVVIAVVATAAPYVGRPVRRCGQVLVTVLLLAALYVGSAFPIDVLGALAVGWGVAALVHLLFGSPGGRPSAAQLEAILADVGIAATSVRLSSQQRAEATIFECCDRIGPLIVKVIGPDELDAQLLAKIWRFAVYKDAVATFQMTRVQEVEHEACMTLLAGSAGVRVPAVVFVGRAGPNSALLVLRRPAGFGLLVDLEPEEMTDPVLAAIWRQVALLHGAGIAHGALDVAHVISSDTAAGIVGFANASSSGPVYRLGMDVADLLAATAARVGDERAIAACLGGLGDTALRTALPFLQPGALHRSTRAALRGDARSARHHIEQLRQAASARLGIDGPALRQMQRLRLSSVLMAAGGLLGVGVLLDQVGDPSKVWDTVRHAQWQWAAVALLISLATNIPYALALMGTLRLRLPLWPTTELQVAMSYSNLVIPVIGGTGFQIRFLQRQGAELPAAVAAGGLLSVVGVIIGEVPLFAVAVALSPRTLNLGHVPISGIIQGVAIAVVALGLASAIALGVPRLRRSVLPPVTDAVTTIWTAFRTPRQLALIFGGNAAVGLMYGFCLLACVLAFGATISFWTATALSIGLGTLSSLIPIPGGSAAVGAVGMSGLLVGLGISTEAAVAITLANQLAVTYLPAIPGLFATRHLLIHDYL